jgi:hypothetical protein
MAHRTSLLADNAIYEQMLNDAARYANIALPLVKDPITGYDLNGISAFTLIHSSIRDGLFPNIPPAPRTVIVEILKTPARIILRQSNALPPPLSVTWRTRRVSNQTIEGLDDTHYLLNFDTYADFRDYVISSIGTIPTGLAAIPCRDVNGDFYFYLGVYKLIPDAERTGRNIINQSGKEIRLFPGGTGGEGDSAGARIPAH